MRLRVGFLLLGLCGTAVAQPVPTADGANPAPVTLALPQTAPLSQAATRSRFTLETFLVAAAVVRPMFSRAILRLSRLIGGMESILFIIHSVGGVER